MNDLVPTILTSFATTMATKGAEGPAQTFNNLWKYVFGPVDTFFVNRIEKRNQNNTAYAKSITDKVSTIPKEDLQEPQISILGPGLEASKFYIDEAILREMFSKLLASSFDRQQNDFVHHSFIEIIKQLSPIDAENFKIISEYETSFPIVNYSIRFENGKVAPYKEFIFLGNPNGLNVDSQGASIVNLQRLGLITVDFSKSLSDKTHYAFLENNNLVDELKEQLEPSSGKTLKIEQGIIEITPFGTNFRRVCL
ncbi:DUF4393 domain-containing protein [Streptococcus sp. H31]|uniref:DUF4393 domain-containing protein n=1 Tax=Streptococcus huangxiaojuni TaxID=3237239 RepID=UPI0034A438BD